MASALAWLQVIRPINLILFFLGQLLAYCHLMWNGLQPDFLSFLLLSLTTICIGAFSNLYNDVIDYPADIINKPEKIYIDPDKGSQVRGYMLFWILASFLLALWYFFTTENLSVTMILLLQFPLSVWYSAELKKTTLWGNLLIGLQCLLVLWIIYADTILLLELPHNLFIDILYLFSFIFFTTLARELTKDIIDLPGDRAINAHTIPIRYGYLRSTGVIRFYLFVLFFLLLLLGQLLEKNIVLFALYGSLFVLVGYGLYLLYELNYKALSRVFKVLIAVGIVFFYVLFWVIKPN